MRPDFPLPDVDLGADPTILGRGRARRADDPALRRGAVGSCGTRKLPAAIAAAPSSDGSRSAAAVDCFPGRSCDTPGFRKFADRLPFVTALVALEEDPAVRLVTYIVDCDPDTLRCDMPVRVVFRPLRYAGVRGEVVAPLFRPDEEPQSNTDGRE